MNKEFHLVSLGEILTFISRPEIVEPDKIYQILGAHWYAEGLYIKETKPGSEIQADKVYRIEQGDFVYNRLFAWKGSFAVATTKDDNCYVSNEFPAFTIDHSKVSTQYLRRYFCRASAWEEALGLSSGGTPTSRNRLKEDKLLSMRIPLPPLEEQQRIVAQIEGLAAKIEKAQELHREAEEEAEATYSSEAFTVLTALSDVKVMLIENIAEVRGGIQKSPSRIPGSNPVRYLTVAHVHRNHISLEDPRFFEVSPAELNTLKLEAGDVLVIEGNGSEDQIGRTALFRGEIDPCVHQNHVIRVRPNQEQIDPEYLNFYLNSPLGQQEIQSRSRTTSGLRTLSVGRIKQIKVVVPPLSVQKRVVAYFYDLQSKVDILKRKQAEISAELDAILPAILDKAFKGEL